MVAWSFAHAFCARSSYRNGSKIAIFTSWTKLQPQIAPKQSDSRARRKRETTIIDTNCIGETLKARNNQRKSTSKQEAIDRSSIIDRRVAVRGCGVGVVEQLLRRGPVVRNLRAAHVDLGASERATEEL